MNANVGESAGNGKSHRHPTDLNVVEDLTAIKKNHELLNVLGRAGEDADSVPVPRAVSVDRQLVEQLLDWRLDCETNV